MNAASFLSAAIDIAIGVAGFAGIVAAVRQRHLAHWSKEQLILLQILFTATAASIVYALLPSFLTETGLSSELVWKVSSGALMVWIVGAIGFRLRQSRAHSLAMTIPRHVMILGAFAFAFQIYNIAGVGQSWPYLFGILILLINGFSVFLVLVLKPLDG